jgi:hypothetical protein
MNKFKIFDYFDGLVSKVDEKVERYIVANQDNQPRIDEVNAIRDKWIKELRECEAFDLAQCQADSKKEEPPVEDSVLFIKFCFVVEVHGDVLASGRFTWRLISTDMYLSAEQVACFQELVKIIDYNKNPAVDYEKVPLTRSSFDKLFNMKSIQDVIKKT